MDIVATGFVADTADLASDYPSAGGDSSDASFQAIYWRCITGFLFSARVNARECRAMLFSNVAPPVIDGIDLSMVFERMGVTIVCLPLTHRLPHAKKWGNVFYFMDILKALPGYQSDQGRFALFDSDVVLAGSITPLMRRIGEAEMVGYRVDSAVDEDVNGLTMAQAARLAERLSGTAQPEAIPHLGGELLGFDLIRRASTLAVFDAMWRDMIAHTNGLDAIRTEEHFWSVAAAAQGWPVVEGNDHMKRLWTARNFRTVLEADRTLPIWHLPAEKRYGFVDMFRWMAERDFDTEINAIEFHSVTERIFGIPNPSLHKRMKDLIRGIRHKIR